MAKPKFCRCCKEQKIVANFSSAKARQCDSCKRRKKIKAQYDPLRIAIKMFDNAEKRCDPRYEKHYGSYIRKGIRFLLFRDSFLEWAVPAIRAFFRANPGKRPSLDRIYDDGHYVLGNLQIIPRPDNSGKRSTNKTNPEVAAAIKADYREGRIESDIAWKHGVSTATVSRVLNDKLACCR